jgi:hypothetical protein
VPGRLTLSRAVGRSTHVCNQLAIDEMVAACDGFSIWDEYTMAGQLDLFVDRDGNPVR